MHPTFLSRACLGLESILSPTRLRAPKTLTYDTLLSARNVNSPKPIDMELEEIRNKLKSHFKLLIRSSLVIVFEYDGGVEVSLFKPSRMLIKM